jgi:anhydro-N-acetylmuramic acid kinase
MPAHYIGLMSGTSLDGVDGVLVDFASDISMRVLAHRHLPFAAALHDELLVLNGPGADELHRAALAANALSAIYADMVDALLTETGIDCASVIAVGAHGQTVRHRPGDGHYTIQLLNGALLAERCAIDVVCDFRSRDVAAGGQGAPLVPAFHQALFARPDAEVAVLNLGGIANLTLLAPGRPVRGFDCGPANVLLDLWCQRHCGTPFDADGAWAAAGRVDDELLGRLRAESYFDAPPPKSTGRDLFNAAWLDARVGTCAPVDVQATLAELTATSIADDLRRYAPGTAELLVCGGGALNHHLMRRLGALLASVCVVPTDARGLPALQVEACAFAWLARAFVERHAGNLPAVTGARGPRVLGALYPAL